MERNEVAPTVEKPKRDITSVIRGGIKKAGEITSQVRIGFKEEIGEAQNFWERFKKEIY